MDSEQQVYVANQTPLLETFRTSLPKFTVLYLRNLECKLWKHEIRENQDKIQFKCTILKLVNSKGNC